MEIIMFLLVCLIGGAIATALMKAGGDWLVDLVIGLVGSLVGSWIFSLFRFQVGANGSFEAFAVQVLVATVGGMAVIALWRLIHQQPIR